MAFSVLIFTMRPCARRFMLFCLALAAGAGARAQTVLPTPLRIYAFAGNLNDSQGGPALVANGGTVGNGVYTFGANQGLTLIDPAFNPANYTIELQFTFDQIGGYRRILEFKNHGADTGLYAYNASLNFYNIVTASSFTDFIAGQPINVVLTRDAATSLVTGYVNGVSRLSFTDNQQLAIFFAVDQPVHFFIDDNIVGGEASAGSVNWIRLYNQPLDSTGVMALFQGGGPVTVPEPAILGLLVAGLGAVGLTHCRRVFRHEPLAKRGNFPPNQAD
jgi:hypothetical protein